jgi:trimeric autotransporter adhesin
MKMRKLLFLPFLFVLFVTVSNAQTVISPYSISTLTDSLGGDAVTIAVDSASGDIYCTDENSEGTLRKVTLAGGVSTLSTNFVTNTVNHWLPYIRTGIVYYGGSIYTFCPSNITDALSIVKYNPATNTTSLEHTPSTSVYGYENGAVVVNGVMYMTDGNGESNSIYKYDFATHTFSVLGEGGMLPSSEYEALRYCHATGKMYYGGSGGDGGNKLYEVNMTTGALTLISTEFYTSYAKFTIDPSGIYALVYDGSNLVTRINLATGSSSAFASELTGSSISDLEFGTSSAGGGKSLYIGAPGTIYEIPYTVGNTAPSFTGGSIQTFTVCAGATAISIDSLITVDDIDSFQTLTWTVGDAPAHGSVSTGSTSASGMDVTPGGFSFTPASGYSGADTFTIQVADGAGGTDLITIAVDIIGVGSVPAISGTATFCTGGSTSLSNATSGGTWSSSNSSIATVDGDGIVSGVSGGTAAITYTVTELCGSAYAARVVTVVSLPAPISGTAAVCEGATTTLSCSPGGGTWESAATSIATIGSTGIVTGVSSGTAFISYVATTGCASTKIVTVNASPTSITGSLGICVGSSASLASTPAGGTWVATFPTRATVNSTTGLLTGVAAGTTPVIYTAGGCSTTSTVTVSSTPSAIGGALTVCIGSATTLTSATTGGTWTSSNGSVATIVSGTGVVTGIGTGTATIAYSNGTCATTAVVTVNAALGANTGVSTVCSGSGTTLSNATAGGTWSTSNASVATVNTTTGLVAGVSGGTTNISYNVGAGCFSVTEVTVNTSLSSITGTTTVCPGATTTLSHGDAGGAWSSGNTARATVVSGTGVVTGVTTGTVFITYTLGGCFATTQVSVSASPGAITGTASMCTGATTALSSSPSGGTWSSATPAIATISSGGVATGISAGTATISYQNAAGCVATRVVTVTASAGTIGGTLSTCIGTTTTLTAAGGGTWSSANTLRATIGSATGIATGVSAGTVVITYALTASCVSTAVFTVTAVPSITGTALICAICTSTLTGTPGGGTWTSSNAAAATIGSSSGIVSGVGAGTTTMNYVAGGCSSTRIVTVNPSTSPSFGTPVVCVGQTNSTLSNPIPGGTWSSSNPSIVTVHAANGLLTGVAVGNANITYTVSPGSWTIIVASVGALVANNVGTLSICPATTTTLTNATAGGSWLSTNTAIATVGNLTGIVTGVTAGTSSISYEVNVGCYRVSTVTIKSQPTITGTATSVVLGGTRSLTVSPGGGTWSSANPAIATATGTGTGTVTGISLGGTTVTYTNSAGFGGCFRTRAMTIVVARPGGPVVSEAAQSAVLKIFPNPTSGLLTIDAPVAGTFTVYTLDGKEVAQYPVTATANMVTLPSHLTTGIYMSRFMGSDGTSTVVRLVYEQ